MFKPQQCKRQKYEDIYKNLSEKYFLNPPDTTIYFIIFLHFILRITFRFSLDDNSLKHFFYLKS